MEKLSVISSHFAIFGSAGKKILFAEALVIIRMVLLTQNRLC